MDNLNTLAVELDYQSHFTLEERIDLFNKYCVPVSQKFFNPIFELASFIVLPRSYYKSEHSDFELYSGCPQCYSHSGAVMSSFNSELGENRLRLAKVKKYGIELSRYDKGIEKYVPYISFNNSDKTITIKYNNTTINIQRNLYDRIDMWLEDFGYEKW